MRLLRLNNSEKKGIIERFYYRKYSGTSFGGIPLINLVDEDVESTMKNKKAVRGMGYTLKDILIEQINFEKDKNNCDYDTYKNKLN